MDGVRLIKNIFNPMEEGVWRLKFTINSKLLDSDFFKCLKKEGDSLSVKTHSETLFSAPSVLFRLIHEATLPREDETRQNISTLSNIGLFDFSQKDFGKSEGVVWGKITCDFKKGDYTNSLNKLSFLKGFVKIISENKLGDIRYANPKSDTFFRIKMDTSDEDAEIFNVWQIDSYDRSIIDNFESFFMSFNKGFSLEKKIVHRPDVDVFLNYPYLLLNDFVLELFEDNFRSEFFRALEEYSKGSISGATRTLGVLLEDLLIQIYEACIRKRAPNSTSLRQIFNKLVAEERNISEGKRMEIVKSIGPLCAQNQTLTEIFEEIFASLEQVKKDSAKAVSYFESARAQIFPKDIQDYLSEAIEYRNINSHQRKDEPSSIEANLLFRCVVSIVIWWSFINKSVSCWDKSVEVVLKEIKRISNNFPNYDLIISVIGKK